MSDNVINHHNPFVFSGASLAILLGATVHSMEKETIGDPEDPDFSESQDLFRSVRDAKASTGNRYVRVPKDADAIINVLLDYADVLEDLLTEVSLGVELIATDMQRYPNHTADEVRALASSLEAMLPKKAA